MSKFISCDWGSSRLRLRLIDLEFQSIVAQHITDEGIQKLANQSSGKNRRDFLGSVLERAIMDLGVTSQDVPMVVSGMASSTLGLQSLPYASLPAPIDGSTLRYADISLSGRKVRLVSGLQAVNDVMRGEETELVGIFAAPARHPLAENCIVVLPGSHSKHVRLSRGLVVGFTTYLTGELYGLLSQNSTLCSGPDITFDDAAFVAGVRSSATHNLSSALFQTRARAVLGTLPEKHSRAFLSGVLVGAEIATLAGVVARYIVLAAGSALAPMYALAFRELLPDSEIVQISAVDLADATAAGHARLLSYS